MSDAVLDLSLRPDVENLLHDGLDIAEAHVRHLPSALRDSFAAGAAVAASNPHAAALVESLRLDHGEEAVLLASSVLNWMHAHPGQSCRMLQDGSIEAIPTPSTSN